MKKAVFNLSSEQEEIVSKNDDLKFLQNKNFYKIVWKTTLPIYLQMISVVILSMINNLLLRWVDNGVWTPVINKANFAYSWFIFIPTFSAGGVFVGIGNLLGKGKREEVYKVVAQGLVFNLILGAIVVAGLFFSKSLIYDWVNLNNEKEIKFADYLFYTNLGIIILSSINTIFQRVETASGDVKKLFIVVLISGVINTTIVVATMFLINPVICISIATLSASLFLTITCFVLNTKHVNFKKIFTSGKYCWESWILKTLLIVSIPSIVETLFFNFAAAFSTKYITLASGNYGEGDILFTTLISVQQITNFGLLMSSSLGQVAMIFVSRLNDTQFKSMCINSSKKIWHLSLYIALPFSVVTLLLSYPLLLLYNIPSDIIISIGIFMFLIVCFQDFGRSMNQVGLSSLRAVKYTIVPVIVSIVTISVFNVGFIYLAFELMLKTNTNFETLKNFILVVCTIQAIEEVARGGIYWLLWCSKIWDRKLKRNEEK